MAPQMRQALVLAALLVGCAASGEHTHIKPTRTRSWIVVSVIGLMIVSLLIWACLHERYASEPEQEQQLTPLNEQVNADEELGSDSHPAVAHSPVAQKAVVGLEV